MLALDALLALEPADPYEAPDLSQLIMLGEEGQALRKMPRPRRSIPSRGYRQLEPGEEQAMIERFQAGDREVGDALAVAHAGFITQTAKLYRNYGVDPEDLQQEAVIAFLFRGAERFDKNRGFKLPTFAKWWIRAFVGRYARTKGNDIELSVHVQERKSKNDPRTQERVNAARHPAHLDATIGTGTGTYADLLADEGPSPEELVTNEDAREDARARVALALEGLGPRERIIVERRLMADAEEALTLEQLGGLLGLTRERVRQLEAKLKGTLAIRLANPAGRLTMQPQAPAPRPPAVQRQRVMTEIGGLSPHTGEACIQVLRGAPEGLSLGDVYAEFIRRGSVVRYESVASALSRLARNHDVTRIDGRYSAPMPESA